MNLDGSKPSINLSVVVPLYNEEDSVTLLYEKIREAIENLPLCCEIIFVNDGSKDQTFSRACELGADDPLLRIIEFKKNYGQTPAMAAGIDHARGDLIVTMDGDLQNDPSDIPMMLDEIKKGYDLVVGWRHKRQDKLITRKIPSKVANWLIGKVTGIPIKDNGCSLKVYRADVMKSTPFYSEMHRFIPALLSLSGARYSQVKVKHHARQFGESKYGLSRIYKVLLDLLMIKTVLSLMNHPFVWFTKIAFLPFIAATGCLIWSVSEFVSGQNIVIPIGITFILFSCSAFLMSLGLISEQIYRTGSIRLDKLVSRTAKRNKSDQTKLSEKTTQSYSTSYSTIN